MSNSPAKSGSNIDALIDRLANLKDKYGDEYPIIWYDPEIDFEEKMALKDLLQRNKSIHIFRFYLEALKFAQSLGISFLLILPSAFDEQKLERDFRTLEFTYGRKMIRYEEEELLKNILKDISDQMRSTMKVYVFCTFLDFVTEASFTKEEEDVTVMSDMKDLVKQFRQEFTIFYYDPHLSFETKEMLTKNIEIEEKDFYSNLLELLQKIRNYNGSPYHLIMTGKDIDENTVTEVTSLKDLLGLYIYRDDDVLDQINHEKFDKAKTLEELIPKIKQGLRTRSKLRHNFPAFATDFGDWDRSHINYVHHYLKGFTQFNNRKQAKDDFIKLAKKIYQDENKLLSQFEDIYDKGKEEKENKNSILYWYTTDSPIYRLLNNCLRFASSDSILHCRFVLKDMENAIRKEYKEKDKDFNGLLYRGAYISAEEWDKLQKNVGQEIEMYGFLSTTMTKRVAVNFLGGEPQNKIFITIIVPPLPELDEQGFTYLSSFSEYPAEKEILFNVRSKFQILQAAIGKIDDRGNRARHLVLLFGAQLLRKYMTKQNPSVNVKFEFPSNDPLQCSFCGKHENLFGFQRDTTQILCFDCLVKNPLPKDTPFATLNEKNPQHIVKNIPGKQLQFTTKEVPNFLLSGYKCCDCQATGKPSYYKWITQDGKEIRQCSECFEKKKEIKADFLVSETYPYTMWLEHQKEWEKIDTEYKSRLSKKSQYADEGDVYIEVQDFHRCIEYGKRVLKKLKLTRCREGEKLKTYKMLGTAYESLGQHHDAETCFATALSVGKFVFDSIAITLYNKLADVSESLGRHEIASKNYREALNIVKQVFGDENNFDAEDSFNGLATMYENLGQHEQALNYYKKALGIRKLLNVENHPGTATIYNNMADTFQSLSMHQEAQESNMKALNIRKSIFGENHPDTATSYISFGEMYTDFGDYKSALQYFEKTINILKPFYGEKHPSTALAYSGLGHLYEKKGNFQKAINCHEKSLEIMRSVKSEKHKDTASSYHNLGLVYSSLGKNELARDYYLEALNISKSLYGETHPIVASSYSSLALVYQDLGELEKALSFAIKGLEMTKSFYGERHQDVAKAYNNLGRVYEDLEDFKKVVENYAKALEIFKSLHGEKHLETANSYFNLCVIQSLMGENKKAKENSLRAYNIRKEILGDKHPDTMEAYQVILSLNLC